MKYSEFYKLIESAGWTIKKGKGITNMSIPTLTTLSQSVVIRHKKFPKGL